MSYTGTCSGNTDDPSMMRALRFFGAAGGTVGGGWLGWMWIAPQSVPLALLTMAMGATFGNRLGSALGHGVYSAGVKASSFFCESNAEHKPLLAQAPSAEQSKNIELEATKAPETITITVQP